MTARDAMTPSPLTVTPRTSVATALRLLRDNQIGYLPVIDQGRVLGVVRAEGLLALTPSEATTLSRDEATDLLNRLTVGRAVEPALTVDALTPLAEAGRALRSSATPPKPSSSTMAASPASSRTPTSCER